MVRAPENPSFGYVFGEEAMLSDVASLPIVRGQEAFGERNKWSTVGTGRRIKAARELLNSENRNAQIDRQRMVQVIGVEFITIMFGREWLWYKCPRCCIPI